ncbi:MAG: hypothetical protein KDJ52_07180 [Anaerolineae bacterium]|nr:hypothetical protein [Anaerolineae bacterium]
MALSFSRSLRSLQHDRFGPTVAALVVTSLLLLAWSGWFFLAQITLYETSREFSVQHDGSLLVNFPAEALARLRPGQAATLRLTNGASPEGQSFPAQVMDIPLSDNPTGPVELFVFSPEPLQPGQSGQVQVEVEQISPAMLVLRSAGQFVDDPKLTVSPQQAQ